MAIESFYEGGEVNQEDDVQMINEPPVNMPRGFPPPGLLTNDDDDDDEDEELPARNPFSAFQSKKPEPRKPTKPSSSGAKIFGLSNLQNDDDEDDEDKGQAFYAGGSETRSQLVLNYLIT